MRNLYIHPEVKFLYFKQIVNPHSIRVVPFILGSCKSGEGFGGKAEVGGMN